MLFELIDLTNIVVVVADNPPHFDVEDHQQHIHMLLMLMLPSQVWLLLMQLLINSQNVSRLLIIPSQLLLFMQL